MTKLFRLNVWVVERLWCHSRTELSCTTISLSRSWQVTIRDLKRDRKENKLGSSLAGSTHFTDLLPLCFESIFRALEGVGFWPGLFCWRRSRRALDPSQAPWFWEEELTLLLCRSWGCWLEYPTPFRYLSLRVVRTSSMTMNSVVCSLKFMASCALSLLREICEDFLDSCLSPCLRKKKVFLFIFLVESKSCLRASQFCAEADNKDFDRS